MSPAISNTNFHNNIKRSLFRWNLGGQENNNVVEGNNNKMNVPPSPSQPNRETLLRKTGTEIQKVLEGGADVLVAPSKWLSHMQEYW